MAWRGRQRCFNGCGYEAVAVTEAVTNGSLNKQLHPKLDCYWKVEKERNWPQCESRTVTAENHRSAPFVRRVASQSTEVELGLEHTQRTAADA